MKSLNEAANESFDVTSARSTLHVAWMFLPGCSIGRHVFGFGGPIRLRSNSRR